MSQEPARDRVWIIVCWTDYVGGKVVSVHRTRAGARAEIAKLPKPPGRATRYVVQGYEVNP